MQERVVKNELLKRYELVIDGVLALLEYREEDDRTLVFTHTFVPKQLRGKNVAAQLTTFALQDAEGLHKRDIAQCSYVDSFIKRNPKFAALRAEVKLQSSCGYSTTKGNSESS